VNAKYLAHDPDLKWVKLATIKGSGPNRVVKEVTVQVAQLNKSSQSRVKQIATLQTKLDELAAEAKDDPEAGEADYGRASRENGAPMADERGNEPGSRYGEASSDAAADSEYDTASTATETIEPAPAIDPNDPDPLGFAELPSAAPPGADLQAGNPYAPSGGADPPLSARAGRYRDAATAVDRTQWASNYDAFHANFTPMGQDRGGRPAIDWGEMQALRAANELASTAPDPQDPQSRQQVTEAAAQLGEINWQVPFVGITENPTGERELQFQLPPLPEPLRIRFILESDESAEGWTGLQSGERVRFVGRFDILQPGEITVRVRKAT
jgi:hypothetical protein